MTSNQTLEEIISRQKSYFQSGVTKNIAFRRDSLLRFYNAILQNEKQIYSALEMDFKKSRLETWSTEIGMVLEEIRLHRRKLKKWSRTKRVPTPIVHFPSTSRIHKEPYGHVMIMAPWNYPFMLALMPFIGAISSGNCVLLKTAHYSENTSSVIAKIISEAFSPDHAYALGGGRDVIADILEYRFDYIFFTGSPTLGKIVMEKASRHLTPVTLELGGKSPCIVSSRCQIKTTARRIIWGKFINAGQTCVAPDYVLVEKSIKKDLVKEMIKGLEDFYGKDPFLSPDFPRIINTRQWERLYQFLNNGEVLCGGVSDKGSRYIAPTILGDVKPEAEVMQEEIFGPILPVLTWNSKEEVLDFVLSRPKPLACYIFTEDKKEQQFFTDRISFGGGCINDTIVHLANSLLPFGGVGESGMGNYHGIESFNTFSHTKSQLKKGSWLDLPIRYPPYTDQKLSLIKKLLH